METTNTTNLSILSDGRSILKANDFNDLSIDQQLEYMKMFFSLVENFYECVSNEEIQSIVLHLDERKKLKREKELKIYELIDAIDGSSRYSYETYGQRAPGLLKEEMKAFLAIPGAKKTEGYEEIENNLFNWAINMHEEHIKNQTTKHSFWSEDGITPVLEKLCIEKSSSEKTNLLIDLSHLLCSYYNRDNIFLDLVKEVRQTKFSYDDILNKEKIKEVFQSFKDVLDSVLVKKEDDIKKFLLNNFIEIVPHSYKNILDIVNDKSFDIYCDKFLFFSMRKFNNRSVCRSSRKAIIYDYLINEKYFQLQENDLFVSTQRFGVFLKASKFALEDLEIAKQSYEAYCADRINNAEESYKTYCEEKKSKDSSQEVKTFEEWKEEDLIKPFNEWKRESFVFEDAKEVTALKTLNSK
jgi:hypothetical protein